MPSLRKEGGKGRGGGVDALLRNAGMDPAIDVREGIQEGRHTGGQDGDDGNSRAVGSRQRLECLEKRPQPDLDAIQKWDAVSGIRAGDRIWANPSACTKAG